MEALAAHNLPGQCAGAGERAAARRGALLERRWSPSIACRRRSRKGRAGSGSAAGGLERGLIADRPTMDELQRRYLQFILEETGWNRRRAAAVLDLDRRTIQRLIARYKLQGAVDPEGEEEGDARGGESGKVA